MEGPLIGRWFAEDKTSKLNYGGEAGSLVVKFYGWKVAPIARNPGGFVQAGGLPGLPEG